MNRSPISDSIKRVNEAIAYLQNTLTPGEIDLLLDELAPLPEPEPEVKPTKKPRRKSNKPASKSARASGMAAAIKSSLDQQREVVKADPACAYVFPDETPCKRIEDNPVHRKDGGYAGYHEFDAGKSSAPPARGRSSTNGGSPAQGRDTRNPAQSSTRGNDDQQSLNASSSTQNSETETESASNVHHAGG